MSTISPDQFAKEIEKTLRDYIGVTEEAAAKGVIDTADEAVDELHSASPAGSGRYGSWAEYNADWNRKNLTGSSKKVFSSVVYNEKHYQLAHLLEKGHALKNGGRTRAFTHIAPVAEKAEKKLLENIKSNIERA